MPACTGTSFRNGRLRVLLPTRLSSATSPVASVLPASGRVIAVHIGKIPGRGVSLVRRGAVLRCKGEFSGIVVRQNLDTLDTWKKAWRPEEVSAQTVFYLVLSTSLPSPILLLLSSKVQTTPPRSRSRDAAHISAPALCNAPSLTKNPGLLSSSPMEMVCCVRE